MCLQMLKTFFEIKVDKNGDKIKNENIDSFGHTTSTKNKELKIYNLIMIDEFSKVISQKDKIF